jgi:hypothetical protein
MLIRILVISRYFHRSQEFISSFSYRMGMNKSNSTGKYVIFAIVVLVVGAAGFYLYQKSHSTSTTAATNGGGFGGGAAGGAGGRGGFAARVGGGGMGTVTAISSTSITITPRSRGGATSADKTYAISSSTNISDNGSTVAATDIAVGNTVLITTTTSDTSTATAITVNPSFGGGGGGGGAQAPAN